jgi:23S rRNA (cytosine1962-C5)-methyltransferase
MIEEHLTTAKSSGYQLLDSGENEKLEKFGEVITARPDTQAIWSKQSPASWKSANARFSWETQKGSWRILSDIPESWSVPLFDMTLKAKLSPFKHTGIFPEQLPNWQWTKERIQALTENNTSPSVLNLFGYTGAASVSAALSNASVTHVDASKASVEWAKENAALSGLPSDAIRWVIEDVRAYVKREVRRGSRYHGIILDPPAFGRGAKEEVWKIEEDLHQLLVACKELLVDEEGSFVLLNGYASGYSPLSFAQLLKDIFPKASIAYGELRLSSDTNTISAGLYARFTL